MAGAAEALGLAGWAHALGGASLALAGLGLALAAAWWQWRAGNGWVPVVTRASRLVDDGPYALSRHPRLLGSVLLMLGLATALQQPVIAGLALLAAVWADRVLIPRREAQLQRAFGGWYSDYARSVRRWA